MVLNLRWRAGLVAAALAMLGSFGLRATQTQEVRLSPVATGFNNPIGIDHHSPSGKLVLSVNFPSGLPYNFELVGPDGVHSRFSDIQGLTDEVKIATVRDGPCQGGFTAGELFTGTGVPGAIARIAPDGSAALNPWITLPGEPGLIRGSLFQDRYCAFGGDLLVVTTAGNVWQVSSGGAATLLASVGTHLEGLTTVPNDAAKYGPWAGRALAGAEDQGRIYAIGRDGSVTFHELGINPEDIDLIPANENFFGVDFGGSTIWGASSEAFADKVGDFLMSQEFPGILWHVRWNGSSFEAVEVARVTQWEHITFSPAGVPPIPPATPCAKPTLTESNFPRASTLAGNEWSADVAVSDADGLVVGNIKLGPRYMANQISVPYFTLVTSALQIRGELKAAGDDAVARSRLVGYRAEPGNPTFVEATYAIDRIPAGSPSCLVVTERYEFWDEQPHGGCEPTGSLSDFPPHAAPLPCSRWKPLIKYEFTGAPGETLASFNAPQRLYLRDEDKHPNVAATFQDEDTPIPNFRGPHGILELIKRRHDFDVEQPPFSAVSKGGQADWDNYHQSFKTITGPQSIEFPFTFGAPGCPECVHIHWRWGLVVPEGFGDRHDGTPIIPAGSTQDVEFAVVAHHDGEEHPTDFHDLINDGESLKHQDLVLWYSATGHQRSDTFFFHGGFFQPVDEADLAVTMTGSFVVVDQSENVSYEIEVTNNGPSFATGVELRDFWNDPEMQFAAADSSAQCSLALFRVVLCDLGDIRPGTTVPLKLTFKGASATRDALVNHAFVRENRRDPNPTNNRARVVTAFVQ